MCFGGGGGGEKREGEILSCILQSSFTSSCEAGKGRNS